jgi:hypothetical protein
LAARNVFLTYNLKAKVADFGLAGRITGNQISGANLDTFPFKWSAYEILKTGVAIKEKSDVWSFGILMWEIFYLGEIFPYADINTLQDLRNHLETGQRLEKPPLCPQSLHDLMLWCWEQPYHFRPTFSEAKNDLKNFKLSQKKSQSGSNQENSNQIQSNEENSDQHNPEIENSDNISNKDFICEFCQEIKLSNEALETHILSVHGDLGAQNNKGIMKHFITI